MTAAQRYIRDLTESTEYRLDQAAREPNAEDTALAMWAQLFSEGRYKDARRWWFAAVEKATRQD